MDAGSLVFAVLLEKRACKVTKLRYHRISKHNLDGNRYWVRPNGGSEYHGGTTNETVDFAAKVRTVANGYRPIDEWHPPF
jgi:hypothetical protein